MSFPPPVPGKRTDGFSGDKVRVEDKIDVGDITNPDYQYNLIEDYLSRNYIVEEELLVKIKEINDDLNVVLPDEEIQRNVKKFQTTKSLSYLIH